MNSQIELRDRTDETTQELEAICGEISHWLITHPSHAALFEDVMKSCYSLDRLVSFPWALVGASYAITDQEQETQKLKQMFIRLMESRMHIDYGKRRGTLLERVIQIKMEISHGRDVSFVLRRGCPVVINHHVITCRDEGGDSVTTSDVAWRTSHSAGFYEAKVSPERMGQNNMRYLKKLDDALTLHDSPACFRVDGICASPGDRLYGEYEMHCGEAVKNVRFLSLEQWLLDA